MPIELSADDFERLVSLVARQPDWQAARSRLDFVVDVLSGSPRAEDLLAQLDLDGNPRGTAVRTIRRLMTFGQDQAGQEALGLLVNRLIAHLGGGEDVEFLRTVLAGYPFKTKPVASQPLIGWRGGETAEDVAEKIIGENTLRDVYFLEVLLDLASAVVRIQGPCTGTGFLIADDLVITNHHVLASPSVAGAYAFQFGYQLDRTGRETPVHTARARPNGLWRTSPMAPRNATAEQLDYTVVQLLDVPARARSLSLRATAGVPRESRVTIIQHPGGTYKKISMQNNFVEYVDECVVQYTTSTEPGSSGSPVLSDEFAVVAIHHAGGQLTEPTTSRRYLRNEGVRTSAIVEDLRRNAPEIYERLK